MIDTGVAFAGLLTWEVNLARLSLIEVLLLEHVLLTVSRYDRFISQDSKHTIKTGRKGVDDNDRHSQHKPHCSVLFS